MGTLVVVLLLLAVVGWIVWKLVKDPDKNDDGAVDHKDVVAAAQEVVAEVKVEAAKVEEKVGAAVEKVKKARKPRAKKAK